MKSKWALMHMTLNIVPLKVESCLATLAHPCFQVRLMITWETLAMSKNVR